MAPFLILILEGPLSAYGAEMVDARGPVREWPGASLLTGLFANALGYQRSEREAHSRLQSRLDFAVRIDREGTRLLDHQNARLFEDEKGWTTRGSPEGREKSPKYSVGADGRKQLTHRRLRYYFADSLLTVAIALRDPKEVPTLDDLAAALDKPARPLFLGRKPCLPARQLFGGFVEAGDALAAVRAADRPEGWDVEDPRLVVRERPDLPAAWERLFVTDERNWIAGVHSGERIYRCGPASRLSAATSGES